MGMFDDIKHQAPCPICNTTLTGWQSKSGHCYLANLTPSQLAADAYDLTGLRTFDFYTNCHVCKAWVEVHVRMPEVTQEKP